MNIKKKKAIQKVVIPNSLFFISDNKKALNKSVLQCRWPRLEPAPGLPPGRF